MATNINTENNTKHNAHAYVPLSDDFGFDVTYNRVKLAKGRSQTISVERECAGTTYFVRIDRFFVDAATARECVSWETHEEQEARIALEEASFAARYYSVKEDDIEHSINLVADALERMAHDVRRELAWAKAKGGWRCSTAPC